MKHKSSSLTTGPWSDLETELSKTEMELSDVISFHSYDSPESVEAMVKLCNSYCRPLICTEWLKRQDNDTFTTVLPIFDKYKVGAYNRGLVEGKTQTYLPWISKQGDSRRAIWQHDIFHADGTPYDSKEIALLKSFDFAD